MTYPCVLEHLSKAAIPADIVRAALGNTHLGEVYRDFDKNLAIGRAVYHSAQETPLQLCDNQLCKHPQVSASSRECAGCSLMVYCSEECQKEDWKGLHYAECEYARLEDSRQRVAQMRYSHRSRAFHAQLIAHLLNQDPNRKARERNPSIPFNHLLPIYQLNSRNSGMSSMKGLTPQMYAMAGQELDYAHDAWWNAPPRMEFKQEWLRPRLSELVERYRDGNMGGHVRVVEGVFQLAHIKSAISLTIKLERSAAEVYKPVYCVSRYGDTPITVFEKDMVHFTRERFG
ncbi:hypothetical protein NMY22_g10936 [Coprinellus aureogranulatus]|nr:hypothetical protein NMY22_g10936 [Coprinellus aureogranulatus]